MVLGAVLMVLIVAFGIYVYLKRQRFSNFAKKVGGPKGLPVIGVLHRVLSMRAFISFQSTMLPMLAAYKSYLAELRGAALESLQQEDVRSPKDNVIQHCVPAKTNLLIVLGLNSNQRIFEFEIQFNQIHLDSLESIDTSFEDVHITIFLPDILYILPTFTGNTKSAFFWLGPKPQYYTYDPEILEKILNAPECINKSDIYDLCEREIGLGIATSKSPVWEHNRKLLQRGFSHKTLLSFFPIFNAEADAFLKELDKLVGAGESDLLLLLQNMTLMTSFATTVGEEVKNEAGKGMKYIFHAERYLSTAFTRAIHPLQMFDFTFQFHKSYKGYVKSKKIVRDFISRVLKNRFISFVDHPQEHTNNNVIPEDKNSSTDIVKQPMNFIDIGLDCHRKGLFTWRQVFDESITMIAASFETSALTLNSLFTFIAMHPEVQEKLFEEVESAFPDKGLDIDYENFCALTYMDMVINETLRLAPSFPLISRSVSTDMHIKGDLCAPQGTTIIIDLFNVHRCKEIWGPDADKFNPDNFLSQNKSGRHPYSFVPFSKGSRNCIGWRYAMMFLKVALSKIIRNYRFSTTMRYEELRCVQNISLRYAVMPKVEVHRR